MLLAEHQRQAHGGVRVRRKVGRRQNRLLHRDRLLHRAKRCLARVSGPGARVDAAEAHAPSIEEQQSADALAGKAAPPAIVISSRGIAGCTTARLRTLEKEKPRTCSRRPPPGNGPGRGLVPARSAPAARAFPEECGSATLRSRDRDALAQYQRACHRRAAAPKVLLRFRPSTAPGLAAGRLAGWRKGWGLQTCCRQPT